MAVRDSVKALAELGFTNLEAEIYAFLLQESPATGYRIAQALGKPAANTYKAIQTLEHKGAVIVEDGSSRMCRAVSSEELLSRLTREFESRRNSALSSLNSLNNLSVDERIYQIRSRDQVFQRCREMLAAAKGVVVAVVPGAFVAELAQDILQTAIRSVDLAIKSNELVRIEGVESVVDPSPNRVVLTLQLVVDAEQSLVAVFDAGQNLVQATWTQSAALAITHHDGIASEICLTSVANRIEEGDGAKRIARTVNSLRRSELTTGYKRLVG